MNPLHFNEKNLNREMKKIVIASDSFKGCLSSMEVAQAVEKGIKLSVPGCHIIKVPIADGGEGMLDALLSSMNGKYVSLKAHDPLFNVINCRYGISGDGQTAMIEMAEASGLPLVPQEKRNPLKTTTFGTGELIRDALDRGCRKIILGIGGSATNDAGLGLLQALGFVFFDQNQNVLSRGGEVMKNVFSFDDSEIHPGLSDARFTIACDVNNPFCGPDGAAYVFAKQKGATETMVEELDKGMHTLAKRIKSLVGKDIINVPGAGAAGGMGGGLLAFLNSELKSGISLILEVIDFENTIDNADLIITGEGRVDKQTAMGKVPKGILEAANKKNIPVIVIAGDIRDVSELNKSGFSGVFSIAPGPVSLEKAMQGDFAKENITRTTAQLFQTFRTLNQQ